MSSVTCLSTIAVQWVFFMSSASLISICIHIEISLVTSSHQIGIVQYHNGYHSSNIA